MERLQKYLAAGGVASRRHAEQIITAGRVTVNGRTVTELGSKVDPARDLVAVDGREVTLPTAQLYLLLHKPRGYVTTASDEGGRPTVLSLLPPLPGRVFPVGRLDLDSEGLLLLTGDGALAERLTHPRYGIEREYRVLLSGTPAAEVVARMRAGTAVTGRMVTPVAVAVERAMGGARPAFWARITLREGRKREVREIAAAAGYPVERLIRVRYGPLRLGGLPPGAVRALQRSEIEVLAKITGLVLSGQAG